MYVKTEIPRVLKIEFPRQWRLEFPTIMVILSLIIIKIREVRMVKVKMFKRIKHYKHKGYSKKKTAKDLKIARKTVRKYWDMTEKEYLKYLQSQLYRDKAFDNLKSEILKVYTSNDNQKLQISAVYDFLEEKYKSLPGTEKSLRNYIRYLLATNQLELEENIRMYKQVPELPLGQQLQIDFGEYKTRSKLKLYIFAAVLSASRYKYIALQETPFTTLTLIDHLLNCFDYLGGMPKELVIDQDSVMVVSENHGDILFTKDFTTFKEEMALKIYTCRKADPESKGKIENVIKFVKNNFLSVRNFTCLEDAANSLSRWLVRRGNGKISQATRKIPASVFEKERQYLRPIRNSIFRKDTYISRETRSVDDKSYISYNSSQYSVPKKYRNKQVDIYPAAQTLFIFDKNTGIQIACHSISVLPGQRITDREHYREVKTKARDLKNEVINLRDEKSWKQFAEQNFKAFPRYIRDQCIIAKKYFSLKLDPDVLIEAIRFCLDNKTYAYNNLWDTYNYCEGLRAEPVNSEFTLHASKYSRFKSVEVATRDLEVYTKCIKTKDEVSL